MELPKKIQSVVKDLSKIPGVGEKTAIRQALFLAKWSSEDLEIFGKNLMSLGQLNKCQECRGYADLKLCSICSNPKRQEIQTLCVVESVVDSIAIEKSGTYKGLYFILGGVLNPLMGVGPDDLDIEGLQKLIFSKKIKEIILAINPSVEGDATCSYIRQEVKKEVSIRRIGFGIPIGSNLDYLDSMTIAKGLENRKLM